MKEPITAHQLKKLHTLLSNHGLMEAKREIIADLTNNRTTSSKQLTRREAFTLIDNLDREDPAKKMIRKIYAICHSMNWIPPHQGNEEEKRMNEAVINMFLKRRGVFKKNLRDYSISELPSLVSQFESIEKHCQEQTQRKALKEEMDSILKEVRVSWADTQRELNKFKNNKTQKL